ncbi:hypothetical protein JCM19237_5176 [Photobacterium aphoticum]|uniref:Aldehyde dehydrogenase n=1 Tax=Photobacterium aphoticum TaxID=754436 RepID=A0A090QJ45_9GAMM|nr:hypothetical protein JCM19237_5176 [Photobacterium aphoticum]
MIYACPGQEGSIVEFKSRYGNYINGAWVAPIEGSILITSAGER